MFLALICSGSSSFYSERRLKKAVFASSFWCLQYHALKIGRILYIFKRKHITGNCRKLYGGKFRISENFASKMFRGFFFYLKLKIASMNKGNSQKNHL
jgi:hypothetical protein